MTEPPVTRYELERARDEAVRLATAEAVAKADENAHNKIVAAVESVVTSVTLQIGMSEKTTLAKIDTVAEKVKTQKAWGVAVFLGGQALAGLIAAVVTRTTPAEAGRTALTALGHFL